VKKYDKVICINNKDLSILKINTIYTVENYLDQNDGCVPQVLLQEIEGHYYKAERFIGLRELRRQKLLKIKNIRESLKNNLD
jgi:hypothetical protein